MFPFIRLGASRLPTYSTVYFAATLLVGLYAFHRLRALPTWPAGETRRLLFVVIGGFVGTHLAGIFPTLQVYARTQAFEWVPRASFVGTLAGGTLAGAIASRGDSVPFGRVADLAGMPWPLLLAFGRIGCLGAGCCYGTPTMSWLGMWLPDAAGQWARRYPTQIMSGIANLLIFAILATFEHYARRHARGGVHWPFDGTLFLLYIGLFCIERFGMEWIRGDAVPLVGPLSWVHLATLAGFVSVVALVVRGWRRAQAGRASSAVG
jgi:phosphatidylglycerol:prolipoprotein diacylglycerol transferase